MKTAKLYSDGASSGNPGKAGAGFVIFSDGRKIFENKIYLGIKTNNEAEYIAAIKCLESARKMDFQKITLFSDSQLLVNQITGRYKVKNRRLKILHEKVILLLGQFNQWDIVHIYREKNKIADRLAKQAIKNGIE
jgi:ribonuclease HI